MDVANALEHDEGDEEDDQLTTVGPKLPIYFVACIAVQNRLNDFGLRREALFEKERGATDDEYCPDL